MRLSAICFESFMERDIALGKAPVERKGKERLFWNALVDKSGNILKSKLPVVLRMPDEAAAFGIHGFQS